jgi:multiple sugar transport system ATP-binding protein
LDLLFSIPTSWLNPFRQNVHFLAICLRRLMRFELRQGRIDGGKLIDGHGVGWSLAGTPAIASGRAVTIGIRPEHVRIENAGLKANVHVVEPTGSETQVVVDLGGTLLTCVFRERVAAKPGEEINIGFDRQALHLFDSTSG